MEIFKDNNDWNEKTIIGFFSFAIMVVIAAIDLVTGLRGISLEIKDYIYQSFVYLTIGSFGIAGLEKFSPVNKTRTDAWINRETSDVDVDVNVNTHQNSGMCVCPNCNTEFSN